MMKNSPIKKPYFYDTKEGIDYFTKLSIEDNPKKLTPKELADIHKVGRDMKRAALEDHANKLKKFDNLDPSSYPSDPIQRGRLLEIGKLEKDLELPPGQRKPRRNIWDEFVKNKGVMPELTAEERIRAKGPSDWDVIYGSMSPQEKGTWNAEKRREKLQKQKEEAEEKKQKRIDNHTKQQWGIPDKKLTDLPIIRGNIKYQKMHNQDLKSKMRGWIKDADNEKKIIFLGFLNSKKIQKELRKLDLFINCSYFEGFPNSVVEALGSGVPVIASQSYGGINEIIKNNNFGYIYNSQEELINAITNFNNGKLKFNLKKNILAKHLKKFSVSENIKNYSKIFEKI